MSEFSNITKERLAELTALVNKYDEAYYENDSSLVSNKKYDALKRELETIERLHPDWALPGSPSKKPGGRPGKGRFKVRHSVRLLSLQDYFTLDELRAWYGNIGSPRVTVEQKIDGLTMALTYENNKLELGATRGDGEVGEVVTENALAVTGVPHELPAFPGVDPENNRLVVRVEVYQPVAEFERCNEILLADGKDPFSNPRNAASGGLRALTVSECRKRGLAAFAFRILESDGWDAARGADGNGPTQAGDLRLLSDLGFDSVPWRVCRNFDDIVDAINWIGQVRSSLPYWTDGAVVKTDDRALAERLGAGNKYPVHSAAYKYPAEAVETTVREIRVQVGRTGVLTPVAVFDPVHIAGTTVSNATCHNQKYLDENGIGPGAVVKIIKSGEIIPKVDEVVSPAPETFKIKTCPVCGAAAVERAGEDGRPTGVMVCPDRAGCPAQAVRYLEFFCSKDVMDIRGLGPEMLQKLYDAGIVSGVLDIYALPGKLDQVAALPKCGIKTARNIAAAVGASKKNGIDRLVKALGIPGVGRHIGRAVAAICPDMYAFRDMPEDRLLALDGVGEITARDIRAYWDRPSSAKFLDDLAAAGVNMASGDYVPAEADAAADAPALPLSGLTIVATGTIEGYTRGDVEDLIRKNGGTPSGSVSKKTAYLVAGANAGSKMAKAKSLGIPVISIADLEMLCGEGK